MELQAEISADILRGKIGRETDVLVDEIDDEDGLVIARSMWDAPEVDGEVWIRREKAPHAEPGDLLRVRITGAETYDLEAEPASEARADRGAACHEN